MVHTASTTMLIHENFIGIFNASNYSKLTLSIRFHFTIKYLKQEVLLRECKRHTDCGLSSTLSATLSGGGGTYLGWKEGYLPWTGGGVPTMDGGSTYLGWGYPLPSHPDLARGRGTYLAQSRYSPIQDRYPSPPSKVSTPSPHPR